MFKSQSKYRIKSLILVLTSTNISVIIILQIKKWSPLPRTNRHPAVWCRVVTLPLTRQAKYERMVNIMMILLEKIKKLEQLEKLQMKQRQDIQKSQKTQSLKVHLMRHTRQNLAHISALRSISNI